MLITASSGLQKIIFRKLMELKRNPETKFKYYGLRFANDRDKLNSIITREWNPSGGNQRNNKNIPAGGVCTWDLNSKNPEIIKKIINTAFKNIQSSDYFNGNTLYILGSDRFMEDIDISHLDTFETRLVRPKVLFKINIQYPIIKTKERDSKTGFLIRERPAWTKEMDRYDEEGKDKYTLSDDSFKNQKIAYDKIKNSLFLDKKPGLFFMELASTPKESAEYFRKTITLLKYILNVQIKIPEFKDAFKSALGISYDGFLKAMNSVLKHIRFASNGIDNSYYLYSKDSFIKFYDIFEKLMTLENPKYVGYTNKGAWYKESYKMLENNIDKLKLKKAVELLQNVKLPKVNKENIKLLKNDFRKLYGYTEEDWESYNGSDIDHLNFSGLSIKKKDDDFINSVDFINKLKVLR